MKIAVSLGLAFLSLASAQAQVFRPAAARGAVLGGIAGAVVGNNSGDLRHNAWKGAAIGAGAGLLVGQAIDQRRGGPSYVDTAAYVRRDPGYGYGHRGYTPSLSFGYQRAYYSGHRYYGYRDGWSQSRRYWTTYIGPTYSYGYVPAYGYFDGYGAGYPYYGSYGTYGGSGAANGLVLGALAGGIIGHNSGDFRHNGWRGAAWGAGLGWLLGTVVDSRRAVVSSETQPVAVPAAAPVVQAAPSIQAVAAPAAVSYAPTTASPMSAANGLFGRN